MDSKIRLDLAACDSPLSVRSFTVDDRMDEPFEITLLAVSPDSDIDLDRVVGHGASFRLLTGHRVRPERGWTGLVDRMEIAEIEPTGATIYFIRIVPDLWRTTLRVNCRIFQHMPAPRIVEGVLSEYDLTPIWRLGAQTQPDLSYRVQYGETDFAFVSRTLEEAGISYFFLPAEEDAAQNKDDGSKKGSDSDEEGKSRLVFCDEPQRREPRRVPLKFYNAPDAPPGVEIVRDVKIRRQVRPGRLALRDHDYRLSSDVRLLAEARVQASIEDRYEVFRYAPGAFLVDAAAGGPERSSVPMGEWRASSQLAAERAKAKTVQFKTTAIDLCPGTTFHVDEHPHPHLSVQRVLLATRQVIVGAADKEWNISGEAVFSDQEVRPMLKTPRPRMAGPQSALVVGPEGEEIHTDELGRVNVQFHWDRYGKGNDKSSCWLRVSQAWAGRGHGFFALPRVGDEVLVDFLEGDPDQPLIVGRVFHASAPPLPRLPDDKSQTVWKGRSTPGGEGAGNQIAMEDRAGSERIWMHAQKDLETTAENCANHAVGKDLFTSVRQNERRDVGGDQRIVVEGNREVESTGTTTMASKSSLALANSAGAGIVLREDGSVALTNGQASIILDGPNVYLDAAGTVRLCGGEVVGLLGGEVHINGRPNVYINSEPAATPLPIDSGGNLSTAFGPIDLGGKGIAGLAGLNVAELPVLPGGFDELGLVPEEHTFKSNLLNLPEQIQLPEGVNKQLQEQVAKVLDPNFPAVVIGVIQTRAEQIKEAVKQRVEEIKQRVEEKLHDLRARVEAAKQQVLARIEAIKARVEAIKARAIAALEQVRARAIAIKEKIQQTVESITARIEAVKQRVLARVQAIKDRIEATKQRLIERFEAMKERVKAVKDSLVKGALKNIEALKMEAMAIVQDVKNAVQEVADQVKGMVDDVREQLGLAKEEIEGVINEIGEEVQGAADDVKEAIGDIINKKSGSGHDIPAGGGAALLGGPVPEPELQGKRGGHGDSWLDDAKKQGRGAHGQAQAGDALAGKRGGYGQALDVGEKDVVGKAATGRDGNFLEEAAGRAGQAEGQGRNVGLEEAANAGGRGLHGDPLAEAQAAGRGVGGDPLAEAASAANRGGAGQPMPSLEGEAGRWTPSSDVAAPSALGDNTVMTRNGGFGGNEIGRTINGTEGATILQSPREGQMMVVRQPGAQAVDTTSLNRAIVDGQMEGVAPRTAISDELSRNGYAVYERPWGDYNSPFTRVGSSALAAE